MRYDRFKCFRQLESTDCAIACIRMVAYYLGIQADYAFLIRCANSGKTGMSIGDITKVCSNIGLDATPMKLDESSFINCPFPIIAYLDNNHYVVVYHYDTKRRLLYIADPALGKYKVPIEDFIIRWRQGNSKGIIILIGTSESFDYKCRYILQDSGFKGFIRFLKSEISKERKRFGSIIILTGICLLFDLIFPFLFQWTIDDGIGS